MYWDLVHDDLDPPYVLPTVERSQNRKRKVFNLIDLEAMVLWSCLSRIGWHWSTTSFTCLTFSVCCNEMLFVIQNDILTAKPRNLDAEIVF